VLEAQLVTLGRQHPETLMTIGNVGANYRMLGRVAESLPLLEEAWQQVEKYPDLSFVDTHLFNAYIQTADPSKPGDKARALALFDVLLAKDRATLAAGSVELGQRLTILGLSLMELQEWTGAEALLREGLAIREKGQPDSWSTFNTKSALGGALLGGAKLDEAEPLLLDGYRGMKQREASIPPQGKFRFVQALERIVKLYEARGDASEATTWRKELELARAPASEPNGARR
jgi:tetratricopeptide (TPR) repeat protein